MLDTFLEFPHALWQRLPVSNQHPFSGPTSPWVKAPIMFGVATGMWYEEETELPIFSCRHCVSCTNMLFPPGMGLRKLKLSLRGNLGSGSQSSDMEGARAMDDIKDVIRSMPVSGLHFYMKYE